MAESKSNGDAREEITPAETPVPQSPAFQQSSSFSSSQSNLNAPPPPSGAIPRYKPLPRGSGVAERGKCCRTVCAPLTRHVLCRYHYFVIPEGQVLTPHPRDRPAPLPRGNRFLLRPDTRACVTRCPPCGRVKASQLKRLRGTRYYRTCCRSFQTLRGSGTLQPPSSSGHVRRG